MPEAERRVRTMLNERTRARPCAALGRSFTKQHNTAFLNSHLQQTEHGEIPGVVGGKGIDQISAARWWAAAAPTSSSL
jgi:hypothetical protein